MANASLLFLSLFGTWVLLSGHFDVFFFTTGAISCMLVVLISGRIAQHNGEFEGLVPTCAKLARYWVWLEWQILLSSLSVTRKIWQINPKIDPAVAWVSAKAGDEIGVTLYANSITLTPGTVSVDTRGNQIQVHALDRAGIAELHKGVMSERVYHVVSHRYDTTGEIQQ